MFIRAFRRQSRKCSSLCSLLSTLSCEDGFFVVLPADGANSFRDTNVKGGFLRERGAVVIVVVVVVYPV